MMSSVHMQSNALHVLTAFRKVLDGVCLFPVKLQTFKRMQTSVGWKGKHFSIFPLVVLGGCSRIHGKETRREF